MAMEIENIMQEILASKLSFTEEYDFLNSLFFRKRGKKFSLSTKKLKGDFHLKLGSAQLELYLLDQGQPKANLIIPFPLMDSELLNYLIALKNVLRQKPGCQESCIDLVRCLLRSAQQALQCPAYLEHNTGPQMTIMLMGRLLCYNAHFSVSREVMAQNVSISTDHVNRLFKRFHCFSYKRYSLLRRMDFARVRLQKDMSIADVCEEISMAQPHFNRYFKEVYGISPLKFRKQMQLYPQSKILQRNSFFDQAEPLWMTRHNYEEVYAPALKQAAAIPQKNWASLLIVNLCDEVIFVKPRKSPESALQVKPGESSWHCCESRKLFTIEKSGKQLYFMTPGKACQVIVNNQDFI